MWELEKFCMVNFFEICTIGKGEIKIFFRLTLTTPQDFKKKVLLINRVELNYYTYLKYQN